MQNQKIKKPLSWLLGASKIDRVISISGLIAYFITLIILFS